MSRPLLDCLQLDGTTTQESWDDVLASTRRIRAFFVALRLQYVGRDDLITRMEYALLRREHVLSYGDSGTGKTSITKQIVGSTTDMRWFSLGLTAETIEDRVFGDPDGKHWREAGEIRHQVEGSILNAHVVHLGETLNGGRQLLESLNDFLEDRDFRRGRQVLTHCPLISTFADTNVDPIEAMKKDDRFVPVIDRYMFLVPVATLTQTDQLSRMLRLHLSRERAKSMPPLSLGDIVRVSGITHGSDLFDDAVIEQAYVELYQTLCEATGRTLTNRMFCKIAELAEVEAMMNGRQVVTLDDLRITGLALVRRPGEQEAFDEAIARVVEGKWKQQEHRARIRVEEEYLDRIEGQIPSEEDIRERAASQFMKLLGDLKAAEATLAKATMTSSQNRDRHGRLRAMVEVHQTMLWGVVQKVTTPRTEKEELIASGADLEPVDPPSGDDPETSEPGPDDEPGS
ncbi:MAG: AAA family ATPase [Parcubacteria group bacterium]|nr:AAA family ATPase [Parcubacteria group bacterium]